MAEQENPRTLSMAETIQTLIDAKFLEVHTSAPAEIVSFNPANGFAVVQPLIKRKYKNEETPVKLPTISNVPVAFPRIGNARVRFPVSPGDEGKLSFCERSIDKWLTQGGSVDPNDSRKFSLSDAVFELGLTSQANILAFNGAADSLEIQFGTSFIEILKTGKFKISDGTNEIFALLVELMVELKIATDSLGITFNGATIAKFEALRVKFDLMKG